MRKMNTKRFNS